VVIPSTAECPAAEVAAELGIPTGVVITREGIGDQQFQM